jgi:hypothetical protein
MEYAWLAMAFGITVGIAGGLSAIATQLQRIAKAMERRNEIQNRQTQP